MTPTHFIHVVLFTFLGVSALAIIRLRDLFSAVMLMGIFSLLSAGLFTVMDAVDVAFTEAAVGTGISTFLLLAALALVPHQEAKHRAGPAWGPLFLVTILGGLLIYGTFDMPPYGSKDAPIHQHVADTYIERTDKDFAHIPNIVTVVLASYRGYDTFGETTVIFTAAVGVMLLLWGRSRGRSVGEA